MVQRRRLERWHKFDCVRQVPDPYCAVYWENSFVGATQVIDGNTDPIWSGETFVVPLANPVARWVERAALRGNKREHGNPKYVDPILRLEMYDYNTVFKDVFVGQVSLSPRQIVKVLATGESEPRVYPLRPKMPTGTMRVAIGRTTHVKTGMTHIVIKVENCKKLAYRQRDRCACSRKSSSTSLQI